MYGNDWLGSKWAGRGAAVVLAAGLASGCGSDPEWNAPDWDANTAEAIAVRDQVTTLAGTMRSMEQGEAYDAAALEADWQAGSPSLQMITHAGFAPIMADTLEEFGELAPVGEIEAVDETGAWMPGDAGGIVGSSQYGLNEGGIEMRQIVDKGLFGGGALYAYAAGLTADGVTSEDVEAIAAVWGADATLSAEGEVVDSANYARAMGFFDDVAVNLTAAHADPSDEEALRAAFEAWELALFARFVYYADRALLEIQAGVTNESVSVASHLLSEGLGLAMGFYGYAGPASGPLAGAGRTVTDAQIEQMMSALGVNVSDLGASTLGQLLTDPAAYEAGRLQAEAAVAEAFGLSAAEVEAFRTEEASE